MSEALSEALLSDDRNRLPSNSFHFIPHTIIVFNTIRAKPFHSTSFHSPALLSCPMDSSSVGPEKNMNDLLTRHEIAIQVGSFASFAAALAGRPFVKLFVLCVCACVCLLM